MSYTIEEIKENLVKYDTWTIRALQVIYSKQTEEEKASEETLVFNGVGFNSFDSKLLSSIAVFYQEKGYISKKQLAILKRRLPKYAKQLHALQISKN